MSFFWECQGDKYNFNPNKTYLIYYRGGFTPPHRGHFNTVKQFTDIGENVHVMIHQIGGENRHGVPNGLSRYIWKTYIRELLPAHRIHLIQFETKYDMIGLDILDSINTVVYIRGNENYDIEATERNDLIKFNYIIEKLKRKNINMDFYYMDRPLVNDLSATIFTQKLIETRGRCRHSGCDCKYRKLRKYYPSELSRHSSCLITDKLQKESLK